MVDKTPHQRPRFRTMDSPAILIADDHDVVRKGLISLFEGSGVRVCGEAATTEETLKQAKKLKPDVVILDVRFGDADGLDVIRRIRAASPQARVVMFTAFDNPTYVARAIAAGAHDYLLKTADRAEVLDAVNGAAAGEPPSRSGQLRRMAGQMARRDTSTDLGIPLTPREIQVLRLITMGLANQEIADALKISVETVKEHVQNLLRKLSVNDRTQAAVWALRHGLG
jgi:DNA-binding NarL/FixJ family response regulator